MPEDSSRSAAARPRIGITTSRKGGLILWLFLWLAVRRAGGRPVRLYAGKPFEPKELDGLLIGGGDDIEATLWGGEIDPSIRVDPERDRLELHMLTHAETRCLPVLGVCRGAQILNVFLGGTLHGDIHVAYPEAKRIRTILPRKDVDIKSGSRLDRILNCKRCRVNALHHQSIDRLGDGLEIVARDTGGIVQGIEHTGERFVLGVQWHPELLVFNRGQQRLFRRLVEAALI